MMLEANRFGEGRGRPVLIAHGLFGSARNWGAVARRLSEDREVWAVDMRNHGASPWDPDHSYPALAGDLAEMAAAMGGAVDVVGHSMGGKAAMAMALLHPEAVRRLVVLDIAPVPYGHGADNLRLIAAMRAVDPAAGRQAALAALGGDAVAAFLVQSLDAAEGRWRLNLDALEANMGRIVGWGVAGAWAGPALVVDGELSDFVTPAHREVIRAILPRARVARLKGAGHWLHADRPRETEGAIRAFLDAT